MRAKLLCIGLASLCVNLARADYNPVPLTPSSFTQDIFIEKGSPPPLANYTTVTVDHGTNNYGNTFFEQGYVPSMPMFGLPAHGTTFTSRSNPTYTYQMPPDYRTNNCAFIGADTDPANSAVLQVQVPTATLKVNNPTTSYSVLSILYASGNSATNVSITVHHQDGSVDSSTMNTLDWFNGNSAYAWIAEGRVQVDGSNPLNTLNSTTQTKLFNADIPVYNGSPITSVDFAWVTNAASISASSYRVLVFALSGSVDGVTYTPIPVSGFNANAVIPASLPSGYVPGTTVTFDQGPNNTSYTMYEQGFAVTNTSGQGFNPGGTYNIAAGTNTGLPHPGTQLTAGTHLFQMPSSYTGNCCVMVGNYAAGVISNMLNNTAVSSPDFRTANIALSSPRPLTALSFLNSSGGSGTTNTCVISYDDGTTQTTPLRVQDWFGGTANLIWVCQGRVGTFGPGLNGVGVTSAAKLFYEDIPLNNTTASATNVALSYSVGGRGFYFGVSAQTNTGGNFYPIAFSGFNADCVVEKEQTLWPSGMFSATTATMDLGTANGNFTWFEQGWVTNGYYTKLGMPASGSTLNSLVDSTHHYQLGSYTTNNAILIDTNHQTAVITPASPGTYSAFALLTAGASIGSGNTMTNAAILYHADGSAETNNFFAYDWFDTTKAAAYIPHARADTRFGTAAGISVTGNQTPRLFETFFQINNANSPVTNIVLQYKLAGGVNWTTYVLAVSATAGAVQPVLGPLVQLGGSTGASVEGSNVVFVCTSETGTQPINNQWQFSADNGTTWANIPNGASVTGANTLGFTNSFLGWTNGGLYRLVATNAAGFAVSQTLTLGTVYSALPDVTQPADSISAYQPNGGSSPAAEGAANAIDNLIGTNRDAKYLNFGVNGGVPFAGPVGLVVTPNLGKTTVSVLRIYTANDHTDRDPADYTLEGSNDGGNTWARISGGALALPAGRNGPGWGASVAPNVLTQALQEVHFPNTTPYFSYRLSFTNAVDMVAANSIQIGEVELLGATANYSTIITRDVVPNVQVYAGGAPTFSITAAGYPGPLYYQWYSNNVPVGGANSASFTIPNVQVSASGSTFYCVVSNSLPPAVTSSTATLTVIAAPTSQYATNIMRDNPVAWFRLNEGPDDGQGDNGVVAWDHWSGNNGVYTNVTLGQPGSSSGDSDTAMLSGSTPNLGYIVSADSGVEKVPGLDFAKPTNNSVALSVEAWVKANVGLQTYDAGIVTKGFGGGGEQFNLDCGGTGHGFRFFVRDATGATHGATSAIAPELDVWHHLVGVLDEANSNVVLYVDGLPAVTSTVNPGVGLLSATEPLSIGSRRQNQNTNYNFIFYGVVDEAAVYNYALSSNQVLAHFYASGQAPRFTAQPTNTTFSEGTTAVFRAPYYGSPTLSGQWYQSADGGSTFSPVSGQTGPTLSLPNVPASYNGYQYYLQVSNQYGTTNSTPATLYVVSGPPQLQTDIPSQVVVYAGRTLTLPTLFYGSPTITYQWYRNGSPLSNNSRVSGATGNVLTIVNVQTNDGGSYQVFAHNSQDGGSPVPSTMATVLVQTTPNFNNNGLGWMVQTNTGYRAIAGNVLSLTDGAGSEATSAFYDFPLYIGGFKATFTYQDVGGGGADGMAFVLQNDPRGPAALGGSGGALGLSGITPSVAVTFNIFASNIPGMSFGLNGAQGTPYTSTAPLSPASGNPINATVVYNGSVLSVALSDAVAQTAFSTNVTINLPALLGNPTAYVGFTGASGGTVSTQNISNFTFTPVPTISAQTTSTNTVVLSWPASIGGYALLEETGVAANSWSLSPATVSLVGNQYQAVVSATGGSKFYRLALVSSQ